MDYIGKYISFVSIESPTKSVSKSKLDKRVFFFDQLGIIGGNLSLCVGMSVLSMFEVSIFIFIILKSIVQDLNTLQKKMVSFFKFNIFGRKKKGSLENVIVHNCIGDQKHNEYYQLEENQLEIKKIYVSTNVHTDLKSMKLFFLIVIELQDSE
jgi:hypothetical protein